MQITSLTLALPGNSSLSDATDRNDRHDPRGKRDYLSLQHVDRYRFALQHVAAGTRVLDVACGIGYGSEMLASHGCLAIGGDMDIAQLAASRRDGSKARDYVALDVLRLPFRDESFDAVVSFETIEHVLAGRRFLAEMFRVLKPGGRFICSTPNIGYTSHPPFHLKEYRPDEYFALIEDFFGKPEKHGQYFRLSDRLIDWLVFMKRPRQPIFLPAYFPLKILGKLLHGARNRLTALRYAITVAGSSPRAGDNPYCVTDYRGDRLLRIMVTVSVK